MIIRKTPQEIERMARAGRIVVDTLALIGEHVRPGVTTAELDAMDDKLVFSRNRDWIPKLEQLFQQSDVFVAVGADHLIGKTGVVSLLQARGFKITRITH